jgi:hypothetical protein
MRRRCAGLVIFAGIAAAPLSAQLESAQPVRFGVAWTRATPQGALGEVAQSPRGFTAWVALPFTRHSSVGLRAELSILPFPEQSLSVPDPASGGSLQAAVRGTIGFTGAGPRLELRRGAISVVGAAMGGFVRVITDVNARAEVDDQVFTAAFSESDYALVGKVSADLHLQVYRGNHGDGFGVVAGVDWMTGGEVTFPVRETLRVAGPGTLAVDQRAVAPTLVALRAGVSVQF